MPRHAKLARTARLFGEQLRRRRNDRKLTQEEFAHQAGIDVSFVSRRERGLSQPSVGVLVQMAKALQIRSSLIMDELEDDLAGR